MIKRTLVGLALSLGLLGSLMTAVSVSNASAPGQQAAEPTQVFVWEEYGVTFTIPATWQTLGQSQNFDLALVSPGVLETGEGTFIMLQVYPALGPDTTLETALDPLAEQTGGSVAPFSAAGLEGVGLSFTDEASGTSNHIVLLPYKENGAVLFIQASAIPDDEETVLGIVNSMVIEPPVPDYAAIDEAWQTSLAEEGRLIYGVSDAPVSLIEFYSYTCGHCANYALPIEHLIALEADTGRMRIETAPLAGDPHAMRATEAMLCAAEQGKGFSAHKALWKGYLTIGYQDAYSEEGVRDALEPLGVDLDALAACMDADAYAGMLDAVRADFLDYGLTGTPTVLLGAGDSPPETIKLPDGQVWSGTVPIDALRALIDLIIEEELSASEAATRYFGG